MRTKGVFIILTSFLIAFFFVKQSELSTIAVNKKTAAQTEVSRSIERWNSMFNSLELSKDQWDTEFMEWDGIHDINSLMKGVDFGRYGFSVNSNNVLVNKIEPVIFQGADIGLSRVCISQGNGDITLNAKSHSAILDGIRSLSERRDVSFESVEINAEKNKPEAIVSGFCLYLRTI